MIDAADPFPDLPADGGEPAVLPLEEIEAGLPPERPHARQQAAFRLAGVERRSAAHMELLRLQRRNVRTARSTPDCSRIPISSPIWSPGALRIPRGASPYCH